MAAIQAVNLTKHYGKTEALKNLSLEVPEGRVFGFLGANGAGKTTTIRLLLGLLRPTAGAVRLFGRDPRRDPAVRREAGYLPGELALYPELTGQELLDHFGGFYGATSGRNEALEALELSTADLRRKTGEYSTGMKQKLGLVQAVQHTPRLLILDEPFRGLDPLIQRNLFELLDAIHGRGTTIFMSTHMLAEVERMCQEVAIIRSGELLVTGEVANLRRRRFHRLEVVLDHPVDPEPLRRAGASVTMGDQPDRLICVVSGAIGPVLEILSRMPVANLACAPPRLDEIFLEFYSTERDGEVVGEPPFARLQPAQSRPGGSL